MRCVLAGLLLLLMATPSALGQSAPLIDSIRLGLPSGQGGDQSGRARRGAWAPLFVRLKGGPAGNPQGDYRLALVSRDTEQTLSRYFVPVPAISSNTFETLVGYVRPEGTSQFEVQVLDGQGNVKVTMTSTVGDLNREILGGGAILTLSLGTRLNVGRAFRPDDKKNPAVVDDPDGEDRGQRRYAFIDRFADLPNRWFGYDAADVVLLPTSNDDFVKSLVEGDRARRSALVEWVARGGKLVLFVGRNHQLVQRFLTENRLIDVAIKGVRKRDTLRQLHVWAGGEQPVRDLEIAEIEVGPEATTLIREIPEGGDRAERPILVQGAHGLGRVLLVGFDPESDRFTNWTGNSLFWRNLDKLLNPGLVLADAAQPEQANPGGINLPQGRTPRGATELLGSLRQQLESFAEIPVISFGWVALFILFYILLVGPIDYFILKKWFKRLELTWITFPSIVIVVSVLAYLAAYYSKGDDLRINKVDLVELDLHPTGDELPQVYGTTWLGVFSPRIKNYTLGIEPSPDWVKTPTGTEGPRTGVAMAVLAAPEQAVRIGSQGLFPQPYDYATDASGLENVPIPVWASRAFEARWRATAKKDEPPIKAQLSDSRVQQGSVQGRIENNLEVPLEGVVLFHDGKMYPVGTMAPHDSRPIELLLDERLSQPRNSWTNDEVFRSPILRGGAGSNARIVKGLLFPGLTAEGVNGGLRTLDQNWRIQPQLELPPRQRQGSSFRREIVLVGRVAPTTGRLRDLNRMPGLPSRLWLDALPSADEAMPEAEGALSQETYLRAYIPIRRN